MKARLTALLVAAIAILTIAAGCGDDDSTTASNSGTTEATTDTTTDETSPDGESTSSSGPVTTSSLSKSAVVKRAAAACEQAKKGLPGEQEAYIAKHVEDGLAQGELYANMMKVVLLPRIEAEIETIRETGAPAGDKKQIEAIVKAGEAGVDKVASLEEMTENADLEQPFAKADQLRKSYGFPVCDYIP